MDDKTFLFINELLRNCQRELEIVTLEIKDEPFETIEELNAAIDDRIFLKSKLLELDALRTKYYRRV